MPGSGQQLLDIGCEIRTKVLMRDEPVEMSKGQRILAAGASVRF